MKDVHCSLLDDNRWKNSCAMLCIKKPVPIDFYIFLWSVFHLILIKLQLLIVLVWLLFIDSEAILAMEVVSLTNTHCNDMLNTLVLWKSLFEFKSSFLNLEIFCLSFSSYLLQNLEFLTLGQSSSFLQLDKQLSIWKYKIIRSQLCGSIYM